MSCALQGTYCNVSGWGALTEGGPSSDQLQTLAIPILSMRDCETSYSYTYENGIKAFSLNTETMFCAGYLRVGGVVILFTVSYDS